FTAMSLRLQAAFGLRREESIKIRPDWADRGDVLKLKDSWTKGGKERDVQRWPRKSGHGDKWKLCANPIGLDARESRRIMSKRPRRNHSSIFKAKVALDGRRQLPWPVVLPHEGMLPTGGCRVSVASVPH